LFFPTHSPRLFDKKKEKEKTGNLEANKWQCPILIPVVLCCSNFVPRDSAQLENRAPNMMWNLLLLSGVVISPKSREWRKYKKDGGLSSLSPCQNTRYY
jgi:ABC-type transport system involved in cytochrome c biogenesis permease component